MTVTIRSATPDDVAQILAFVQQLAAFERAADAVEATEASFSDALFGPRRTAEAIIAERDGIPVAMALFFHNFSTWTGRPGLYLEDLYVVPAERGRGTGTALLRYLAALALDRGCARFEWAVLDWNTPAVEFYRAIGATGLDEWTVQRVDGAALHRLAGRDPAAP